MNLVIEVLLTNAIKAVECAQGSASEESRRMWTLYALADVRAALGYLT